MKTQKPIEREPITQPFSTRFIDVVFPGHSNHHGTMFGGAAFALMDRVAFISATRFGRVPFVTASCERIDFKWPVRIGQIVEATARPLWAGRKALTVEAELIAENLLGGERRPCTRGLFNMVATIGPDAPSDWALATLLRRDGYQAREGETVMTEIVFADQSNASGNMFGGEAIAAMTKAAFVCATRHCRRPTVVAASDEVHFHHPVKVGSIIDLVAHISRTGNRSMVVAVQLWEDGILSGKRSMAAESRFTMVATKVGDTPEHLER